MNDFICKYSFIAGIIMAGTVACVGCRGSSESRGNASPATTRVDPPAGPGSQAPNLFVSKNDALLTWIEPDQGKKSIRLARFSQGHWSDASTVVASENLLVNFADVPAAAEAGDRIFVAFPEYPKGGHEYHTEFAISTDGGKSFSRRGALHGDTSDTEHGFAAFAPESANSVRAFWLDQRAAAQTLPNSQGPAPAMRLYTAVVGEKVTNEVLLDERTCDCCNLGAGRTDQGPIVAYRDRRDDEVRDISIVRAEGQGFSKPMTVHDDGYRIVGCPVNGPALVADSSRVAIAWYTYASEQARVKLAFSSDAAMHFSDALTIADANGAMAPLGRVTLAWGDQGDVLIGYLEAEREKARLVVRRVHPDGAFFAPLVVAETRPERKSGFPKMVRLDDRLLVVWTEAETPSHLRAMLVPLASVPRETPALAPEAPFRSR